MKYVVFVPVRCTQKVIVDAEDASEARDKAASGDIEMEDGAAVFEEVDQLSSLDSWAVGIHWVDLGEIKVDLKWSLWSADKKHWEQHAPRVWEDIEKLKAGQKMHVRTAPRKEIRYGSAVIKRHPDCYVAAVDFATEWDEMESLCDTLGIPEDRRIEVEAGVFPLHENGIGVTVCREVRGETVEALMLAIDEVEARLLDDDTAEWDAIEKEYGQKNAAREVED